jgi:hypothetical protein
VIVGLILASGAAHGAIGAGPACDVMRCKRLHRLSVSARSEARELLNKICLGPKPQVGWCITLPWAE